MSCMMCYSTVNTISVYDDSDAESDNIKIYLIDFFGDEVFQYLQSSDAICSKCSNALQNFSYIKDYFTARIFRKNRNIDTVGPLYFGKLWEHVSTLKFDCDDHAGFPDDYLPNANRNSFNTSPFDLLFNSHNEPYEPILKKQNKDRERMRSLSRATDKSCEELDEIFSKKKGKEKKRRGRPRTSISVRRRPRNEGPYTDVEDDNCSDISSYSAKKRKVFTPRKLEYKDGVLINKRTRSVSRMQEESNKETFVCNTCNKSFNDSDDYTDHMIAEHNCPAYYSCDQCSITYTEKKHLLLHKTKHDQFYYNCFMCGVLVFTSYNLQQHLQEHLTYSVPCNYCDKSFLNKGLCDEHIKESHKGKKTRIRKPLAKIYDRIDKSDNEDDVNQHEEISVPTPLYNMENIVQEGRGENEIDSPPRRLPSEEADLVEQGRPTELIGSEVTPEQMEMANEVISAMEETCELRNEETAPVESDLIYNNPSMKVNSPKESDAEFLISQQSQLRINLEKLTDLDLQKLIS